MYLELGRQNSVSKFSCGAVQSVSGSADPAERVGSGLRSQIDPLARRGLPWLPYGCSEALRNYKKIRNFHLQFQVYTRIYGYGYYSHL